MKNAGKMILHSADNISSLVFGLAGASMIARVFGPENLGRLSLVQAMSMIFLAFATLGLDHFIMRDLSANKRDGELKGSILLIQSAGWLIYLSCIVVAFVLQGKLANDFYLIASVVISTYFGRILFFRLFFQAINEPRALATSALISRSISLLFLICGTFLHFNYELMVCYLPIQAISQTIILYCSYRRVTKPHENLHVSSRRVRSLLVESFPVFLSSFLYYGYNQADILIMSYLLPIKTVGIYSAAMRLVPQAIFIGHVTVLTFYSQIRNKYESDTAGFEDYAIKVTRIQISIAFAMATTVSLLSPFVIWLLYGSKFDGSAVVLCVGVWSWLFTIPACLFTRLLVLTRLARYELIKVLIIAPISLGLNFVLIPEFGFLVAAYVSVFAYCISDLLIYAVFKDTRFIFNIYISALSSMICSPLTSLKESLELLRGKS